MISKLTTRFVLCSALLCAAPLSAQIADDNDSYSLLAMHCAKSASDALGVSVSPSQYAEYSQKLAKTLSLLSAEQQERVFGNYSGGSSSSATKSPPEEASTMDNLLAGLGQKMKDMEDELTGEGDNSPTAIIGGSDPADAGVDSGIGTLVQAPGSGQTLGKGLSFFEKLKADAEDAALALGTTLGSIFGGSEGDDDGNHGHGDDDDGHDESNPAAADESSKASSKGKSSKGKSSKGKSSKGKSSKGKS